MEIERGFQEKSYHVIDEEKWVCDSSHDYKGRVTLRASTGVWKASLFIIALEVSERLSFFAIDYNLITYLTEILHQDVKTAAKNVNYWVGVTAMMPLIGGFIADAYLGRFLTVVFSSIFYLMDLILLIMSQFVQSLKPYHTKLHKVIFFTAIYVISIATEGHKPSLEGFGADQFYDDHSEERKQKMSSFNLWTFSLCCGLLVGVTVVVNVQDNLSWGLAVIILTSAMAITTLVFLLGRPFYRYKAPEGSPLTPMLQVLVAAIAKRSLPYPSDSSHLYEFPKSQQGNRRLLQHTSTLRFLDKAAIFDIHKENETQSTENPNPWRLKTVTEVESMKLVINMVPIWMTSLMFGVRVAQTSTFFINQGSIMNRKITHNFEIPPASVSALNAGAILMTILIYDRILVPILRRVTGNERGISILQRVGIGIALSVLAMALAAVVERKRLSTAEEEVADAIPMSVFWLSPQYMILGIADAFALVGLQEYFYDQVPDAMRSLGIAFFLSVIGASNFLSSFLIFVVDHATQKDGRRGWFAKDLNKSRLDCFYWLLTV